MNESKESASNFVLRAKVRDVRIISSLLKPIAFSKICQVNVSNAGLQVITELNGVLQATAYIGRALFDEFHYQPEPEATFGTNHFNDDEEDEDDDGSAPFSTFDVSMETWLTCLNIYNTALGVTNSNSSSNNKPNGAGADLKKTPFLRGKTVVEMSYVGKGNPLILELKDLNVSTRCELSTFETNTLILTEMPFMNERTVGQVIMHSKRLIDALMSIDDTSKNVTFEFLNDARMDSQLPQTPTRRGIRSNAGWTSMLEGDGEQDLDFHDELGKEMMRITAEGDHGSVELDFPNKNRIFESFSVHFACKHSYSFKNIQNCFKALQTSIKSSLRIDDQGMMSLQCLFPDRPVQEREAQSPEVILGPEQRGFVEIRILSVITDENE